MTSQRPSSVQSRIAISAFNHAAGALSVSNHAVGTTSVSGLLSFINELYESEWKCSPLSSAELTFPCSTWVHWCHRYNLSNLLYKQTCLTRLTRIASQIDRARFNVPPNTDGFLRVKWPNQQCDGTEWRLVLRIRLQSHQVHPIALTKIQQNAVWNKITQNTHK